MSGRQTLELGEGADVAPDTLVADPDIWGNWKYKQYNQGIV